MYDNYGFIELSWAEVNIDGFSGMDPCCQQLTLLFPDVPHRCSDLVPQFIPMNVDPPMLTTTGEEHYYPLIPILSTPFIGGGTDGGGNGNGNVPEIPVNAPTALPILIVGLVMVLIIKKLLKSR